MGLTITEKILKDHLVEGQMVKGQEIAVRIDQTLTQDATGTMAYLQFEAIGLPRVKTELSVSYVDHNTLQGDFRNADDHRYLQSVAARYGLYFSRPGNGICHQLHLERFARPGKTLLGSDSHTPTSSGIGMIAMGAGGLDVAAAMAGEPFRIKTPQIVKVFLTGELPPYVSAKDVILEVLRRIDVKGAVGKVLEYTGPGVKTLSVPERGCITNMGTETGSTSSVFPSDEITKAFLKSQAREEYWIELLPDDDAEYDDEINIDLSKLEPLASAPHSPGKVVPVKELEGMEVDQVCIGSCTNSSLLDLKTVAQMLRGKTVAPNISLTISPGSRQVVEHLIESGEMKYIVASGARILENTCGPCIGMGQAPNTDAISVRTFNRNFEGRSGTKSGQIYLVSPETAAATAISGVFSDPTNTDEKITIQMPEKFIINDNMIIPPREDTGDVRIIRGPNIKPLPQFNPLPDTLDGTVLLKVGDNITTDHIMPAGAKILPLRSNIPEISKHVFEQVDENFYTRAMEAQGGFIMGAENYGQGSSREHAALAPKYLKIKAVLVKSFARIHLANLINFGIVPLTFKDSSDYDKIDQGDKLEIDVSNMHGSITMKNLTKGNSHQLEHTLSERDIKLLKAGGKLPYLKQKNI